MSELLLLLLALASVTPVALHEVRGEEEPAPHPPPLCSAEGSSVCWVVQVSDLHLSIAKPSREAELRDWADDVLRAVQPSAVVVTGDLTHSVRPDTLLAAPVVGEFEAYAGAVRHIAEAAGLSAFDVLDVRGNHDSYSVIRGSDSDGYCNFSSTAVATPGFACEANRFASRCYPAGSKECLLQVTTADWTPSHGFGGFLNFLGEAPDYLVEDLGVALGPNRPRPGSVSLVFGHYPLNTLTTGDRDGRRGVLDMLRAKGVAAYMGGHLHRFGKLRRQHDSARVLELVLPDWKNNRFYRVMAADRGVLSFVDLAYPRSRVDAVDWGPVMLITSPPDLRHNAMEALYASAVSWCPTGGGGALDVRALVFERGEEGVLNRVDGELLCDGRVVLRFPLEVSSDKLYSGKLAKSQAHTLAIECGHVGLTLSISAETSDGRRFVSEQDVPLSVDALEALSRACEGSHTSSGEDGFLIREEVGWLSGLFMRMSCHDALTAATPTTYLLCVSSLLLIPRLLGRPSSDRTGRGSASLISTALDDLRESASMTPLWVMQVAYASAVAYGPVIFLAEAGPGVVFAVGFGCLRALPLQQTGSITLFSALTSASNALDSPCAGTPEAAWILIPWFIGVWVPLTLWISQCAALLKSRDNSQWGYQSVQLVAIAVLTGNLLSRGTQQCGQVFLVCNLLSLAVPLAAIGLAIQARASFRLPKSV